MSASPARRSVRESRHRAREAALQMLYQWEVGRLPMSEVRESFWRDHPAGAMVPTDDTRAFAALLADGVAAEVTGLDALIAGAAEHWRVERMNVLDRLVLRMATYELQRVPDTPPKVVIDEALELGRAFCGEESVPFLNGVLDAISRTLGRA